MQKVLVTGGCGYIGSHAVVELLEQGYEVVIADNFLNSDPSVLYGIEAIAKRYVSHIDVDLCDLTATRRIFEAHPDLSDIVHFAALKHVNESVRKPLLYYQNNLTSLLNVLRCMADYGINRLVFSSSCSVYGQARELPVTEETPLEAPQSPYARTKRMGEEIIRDFCTAHPQSRAVLLRYFNPAGAHPSALIGESSRNEASNLAPVITETAIGRRAQMRVHGADYPTRDGSCVRDFIHVVDLAAAHVKSLQYLQKNENQENCEVFNLGIGQGVTVLEAIRAFEEATGRRLNFEIGPRRAGDVAAIYCNYAKAAERLGWQPRYDMRDIMRTAWAWEQVRSGEMAAV